MSWQFWVDRGGTFTDIVARRPDGTTITHKLLSDNPDRYPDAALQGIRDLLGLGPAESLIGAPIHSVKMGTTVATNALLERQGEPTLLVTTVGFGDALRIGYQARPDLFALDIVLPEMVYSDVLEISERIGADGAVLEPLNVNIAQAGLAAAFDSGYRSVAICLMHGYRHRQHEIKLAEAARRVGFTQVSVSHEVSPLMKLVSRGDTTVVDAYLSPVLRRYVRTVADALGPEPALTFMQSNGGLTNAHRFQGKDALLSGPAGGVVGMIRTAEAAGFSKLVGFDMGGTSTDVSHYAGDLERTYETEVAGVRVRAPMIHIHTVAAGGGSVLAFDGARLRVGPTSAGAFPGPASYGNGGPLAVTDCNVVLGKLVPEFFPMVFGSEGNQPLDVTAAKKAFAELARSVREATGGEHTPQSLAEGFLAIAVEAMANAIKKISVQRGYDVGEYALVCFGGAGGQHACLVADRLGISSIVIHPHAGVLSAYGIGLADIRHVLDHPVEAELTQAALADLAPVWLTQERSALDALIEQGVAEAQVAIVRRLALRYRGSDTALWVDAGDLAQLRESFEDTHRARFGFVSPAATIVVESIQVEAIGANDAPTTTLAPDQPKGRSLGEFDVTMAGQTRPTPFWRRSDLVPGSPVVGPAVIVDDTSTTVVEPDWSVEISVAGDLILQRVNAPAATADVAVTVDPVQLEIFNNLFMNIAEQMGLVLENTAVSVNIKERLDFSCAVFDPDGELIANAPHMPVHLGSMSESVKSIIDMNPTMEAGDVYVMNAPYNGGTHLPDITVIKPVFGDQLSPLFYVASRGHHADIGGTVPGSAPAHSRTVEEEGVLLDNIKLVEAGVFLEDHITEILTTAAFPARNPAQNVADLKAQVAACEKGVAELLRVIDHYGLDVVHAYMGHVKVNAEEAVRKLVAQLEPCSFIAHTDDGYQVAVRITPDHATRTATVDFTGTSPTHPGNANAPAAVCHAAVLYVFRCLVDDDIPLNAGCMEPLNVVLPPSSMINPDYPAAVFAGNVETSQLIVDALFGALGTCAASQGTMNNVIWGNDTHQYYETICGGAGATATASGCSAVHTHMTNSRLTDPEVLEWRFPVVLEEFSVRKGSGGEGFNPGGDGVRRRVRFNEAMELNILSSRRLVSPYGLAGGGAAATGSNRIIRRDGTVEELDGNASANVGPGDVIEIQTPGGGGFGVPKG